MKLTFKKLSDKAVIPTRATAGSAGMDICACLDEPVTLAPNEIRMIPTGLTAESDCTDVAMLIYPRSGLSTKYGVSLANCVGVVDSDYRGEVCAGLCNVSDKPYVIEPFERVAQMVIAPVFVPDVQEVAELSDTQRGEGGFGSTGRS